MNDTKWRSNWNIDFCIKKSICKNKLSCRFCKKFNQFILDISINNKGVIE